MSTALRYLVGAVLLGVVAFALWTAGRVERRIADADRHLATLNLRQAARGYADVADTLAIVAPVPWLLDGTRDEIAWRQAATRYWRADYARLVEDYTGVDSPSMAGNLPLQFVVANADYLALQRPGAGRDAALGALDHAIGVYRRLLEANEAHLATAYNYELMVCLRAEIASGDAVPNFSTPTIPGNPGENPEEADMEDIQIYVPQESIFDPEDTEDPTVGEGAPIRRRG
jgi:hypothetical protein